MDNHFLTDIEIIDFKCFQNFKASGFKRVNLIGGKNNIGKTAFMEACAINVASENITAMIQAIVFIKIMREKPNLVIDGLKGKSLKVFLDFMDCCSTNSNLNVQNFITNKEDGKKEYHFYLNNKVVIVNANELSDDIYEGTIENAAFIDSLGLNDKAIALFFQSIQKLDKEPELNNLINIFDKNIINFKVIAEKPMCKIDNQYRDLVEFGDGLKHYISIICALYKYENGSLFIDEIGNGIHYQQLDQLWKVIFTISKETNCQVFATTHSKEMIESFARVSQKLNEQDISFTTLVKNDKNEVKALVQDYEMFMYSMNSEHEVR